MGSLTVHMWDESSVGLFSYRTDVVLVQVTFLYKLTEGSCPKSYGMNVARLAGLPNGVVMRASSFASQLEAQHENRSASNPTQLSHTELEKVQCICSALQRGEILAP